MNFLIYIKNTPELGSVFSDGNDNSEGLCYNNLMKENIDPKMHTAEHILNQTMVRMFNTKRCFNAHIEKKKSKCDYRFDRFLTADEIIELEKRVNDIIQADLSVTFAMMPAEEAKKLFNSRAPQRQDAGTGQRRRGV